MITRYILHDLQEDHNLQLQFADSIRELAKKNSDAEVVNIIIDSHSGAEHDFYDNPDPDRLRRQKMELSLRRVLSEDQYMEAFMEHLSKELSMECLLSLIEFLQFREKAQDPQYHNTLKKSKLRTSIDQEFGQLHKNKQKLQTLSSKI